MSTPITVKGVVSAVFDWDQKWYMTLAHEPEVAHRDWTLFSRLDLEMGYEGQFKAGDVVEVTIAKVRESMELPTLQPITTAVRTLSNETLREFGLDKP
jgi:hypothetical protein